VILAGDSPRRSRVFRDGNIYRNNLTEQVQFIVSVVPGRVDRYKLPQGSQENVENYI